MSYLATQRAPAQGRRTGGPGRAMGDVGVAGGGDPLSALASQVNRFGPAAPAAYQFTQKVFPLATGKLDPELALIALTIYQRRATDAYNQFHDAGSEAAIARANAGFADPVTFVMANLAEVASAIGSFADSLGIAGASSSTIPGLPGTIAGIDTTTILLAAGGALVLWMVTR